MLREHESIPPDERARALERRAQLIRAAHATRTWVRERRREWSDEPLGAEAAAAVAAPAPSPTAIVSPPKGHAAIEPPRSDVGFAREPQRTERTEIRAPLGNVGTRSRTFARVSVEVAARWSKRIAILVAVLGALGAIGWKAREFWLQRAATLKAARASVEPRPADPPTGRLQVDSNPEGAKVVVDGRERGLTPLRLEAMSVGSHVIELNGDNGSVRRTVVVAADQTAQVSEAIYAGWLHVSSPIELTISEAARALTLDEKNQVMLSPGSHELQFQNRALGYRATRRVDIKPGTLTPIAIVPPPSTISVTATNDAEVFVDGERAGNTPLVNHAVNLGTREVVVRAVSGLERRLTITVTATPARLDVDFSKP